MNPDHDDHDDMPRAVEHALRKHNALDDELCRTVAGQVWQDMQQAYDDIYGMWREEMRAARELERERDWLRKAVNEDAAYAESREEHLLKVVQGGEIILAERDRLREAIKDAVACLPPYAHEAREIMRTALEDKP